MAIPIPFASGQFVVAVLREPKERFWGRLLGLETSGVALRGVSVAPWEEILALVKRGEADQVAPETRFLPMHRIESLYLDEPGSGVSSLAEEFKKRTGVDPASFLADLA
jgi:predicted dithiol-disulfide oxidoreductase (DUF899 family)